MNEFDTIEKCMELFRTIGCLGNENNIFVAYKDCSKTTGPSSFFGGAVGGFVNGMEEGRNYPYDGLLINQTEYGIAMFMLKQPGIPLTYKLEKMVVQKDKYIILPYQNITEILVKKPGLIGKNRRAIRISDVNGMTHNLFSNLDEPLLPYHKDGFARFLYRFPEK